MKTGNSALASITSGNINAGRECPPIHGCGVPPTPQHQGAQDFEPRLAHSNSRQSHTTSATAAPFTPFLCAFVLLLFSLFVARAATENQPKVNPARFKVSGYGLLGNRELKRTIQLLESKSKQKPDYFDANFVEDAALILLSRMTRDGYLAPHVIAEMTLADGTRRTFQWSKTLDTFLPRPLLIHRVHFKVRPGVLFYYEHLEFTGLRHIKESRARAFFVEADSLLPLKSTRIYTPARLERSMANLAEALTRMGFQDASVTATNLERNDTNGAVRVQVRVVEGMPSLVRSITTEVRTNAAAPPQSRTVIQTNAPYSRYWAQDFARTLRTNQYQRGFPDATVEVQVVAREVARTNIDLAIQAEVVTGPKVDLGKVRFEGDNRTRRSVLKRRVILHPGDSLDRMAVERGRFRLSRLGVFDAVEVRYDKVDDDTRDVIYELQEGKVIDISLLFGYGSYELLRGGFELSQNNVFGRAHQSRLRAIQSFRSSSAEYLYTMPELFKQDVNVFLTASALRREEVSFLREEYGGGIGAQRFFPSIKSDLSVRYNYQLLNASEKESVLSEGVDRALVSAMILDLKHDRRDNPLLPHRGYKVFSNVEFASAALGGEVDYQRVELAASYHFKLGRTHYLHFGLAHGAMTTFGGSPNDIPFNKRFFPGGESSVRGFQQGEAAPRDSDGDIIGAETYLQGNVEFEQVLTPSWSLVAFVDGVGFSRDIAGYPMRESLFSAGGGIRWKTLIGPARLEYGHNLNPRRDDPSGTIHFSLGFPF